MFAEAKQKFMFSTMHCTLLQLKTDSLSCDFFLFFTLFLVVRDSTPRLDRQTDDQSVCLTSNPFFYFIHVFAVFGLTAHAQMLHYLDIAPAHPHGTG